MKVTSYEIGQIVFLLDNRNMSLFPVRVIKETQTRTLEKTITTFEVEYEDDEGKGNVFSLPYKHFQDFASVEEARTFMIKNATIAIDEICQKANQWKNSWKSSAAESERNEEKDSMNVVQETETVLLDNGMVARIKMPPMEK